MQGPVEPAPVPAPAPESEEGTGQEPSPELTPEPEPTEDPGPEAKPPEAREPEPEPPEAPEPEPQPPENPEPVDLEIDEPTVSAADEPYQWLLTVPILATEGMSATSFTIDLELTTNELTGFIKRLSVGWDCGPIQDGDSDGNPYFFGDGVPVTCEYIYEPGQPLTPLQLVLESIAAPSGTVAIDGSNNADPDTSNNHRTF